MDTNNSGQVEGSYVSLPFGDGFSVNGADDDTYHFAGMDYDYNSGYTATPAPRTLSSVNTTTPMASG